MGNQLNLNFTTMNALFRPNMYTLYATSVRRTNLIGGMIPVAQRSFMNIEDDDWEPTALMARRTYHETPTNKFHNDDTKIVDRVRVEGHKASSDIINLSGHSCPTSNN